ncbi:transmembrane protein 115 isoform X2 [Daktulosphaira vitifoliae]|uniref:transmembrane protein 115 isoform X2 n=1 Tax=Daktulosphaira vitifoliae TaxID=58002 RepID=UPI0021AA5253|nr:transmembrane protein 115 isoform X2 [Daktulosphaira vitifoliae]
MSSLNKIRKNIPHIKRNVELLFNNTGQCIKVISFILSFCYFFSFFEKSKVIFGVTPGYVFPPSFWLWTPFTFCFFESHLWQVLLDIAVVAICGKLIEPLWGELHFLIFFAIVNIGVGLSCYLAGVTVAVKQIMPDSPVIDTPVGRITNRNMPLYSIITSLLFWIIGFVDSTKPTMVISGVLTSWIYLRFYQRHTNGTRGDMADNFSFASFFPVTIQPPISVLSNSVYSGLVRAGICRKTVRRVDIASAPTGITVALPGIRSQDIDRRKLLALKALNTRLVDNTKETIKSNNDETKKKDSVVISMGDSELSADSPKNNISSNM